jgi:hypothetical protein
MTTQGVRLKGRLYSFHFEMHLMRDRGRAPRVEKPPQGHQRLGARRPEADRAFGMLKCGTATHWAPPTTLQKQVLLENSRNARVALKCRPIVLLVGFVTGRHLIQQMKEHSPFRLIQTSHRLVGN